MTPLTIAQEVLAKVVELGADSTPALPTDRWAQYGPPILTCPSVAVGITTSNDRQTTVTGQPCEMYMSPQISASIARECQIQHDESGDTIPEYVTAVAAEMDADYQILEAVREYFTKRVEPGTVPQYNFSVEGAGLGICMLVMTLKPF